MTLLDSPAVVRTALDGTSEGIWLAYPAGVVCYLNDPFRERFGWSAAALNEAGGVGRLFYEAEETEAAFDAVARGEPWEETMSLVTREGGTRTVHHRVRPISEGGEFFGIVGYVGASDD